MKKHIDDRFTDDEQDRSPLRNKRGSADSIKKRARGDASRSRSRSGHNLMAKTDQKIDNVVLSSQELQANIMPPPGGETIS